MAPAQDDEIVPERMVGRMGAGEEVGEHGSGIHGGQWVHVSKKHKAKW